MKRFWSMVCVVLLAAGVFAGCQSRGEEQEDQSETSVRSSESDPERETEAPRVVDDLPDYADNVAAVREINDDTVGWLRVPGTDISDAVVHKPDDETNKYYERKDINQQYNFNGVYYADCSSTFGDGTRDGLGVNICIYGHTISDDPESEKYNIKFGQLHDFQDPEKAKQMPYLYFSTGKETFVYEVLAVFIANCDNNDLPYNRNLPADEFVAMVREEVLPRSIYDYDVDFSEADKFLTLSTCIYDLPDGTTLPTSNMIRYGVLGKLLPPDAERKETASFTPNTDLLIDPDGAMHTKS